VKLKKSWVTFLVAYHYFAMHHVHLYCTTDRLVAFWGKRHRSMVYTQSGWKSSERCRDPFFLP
jgi:hypothetical protein